MLVGTVSKLPLGPDGRQPYQPALLRP